MSTANLTGSAIAESLGPMLDENDREMRALLQSLDGKQMSSQDLLSVQMRMQNLSLVTGLHSTIVKSLHDMLKEIIQKSQ